MNDEGVLVLSSDGMFGEGTSEQTRLHELTHAIIYATTHKVLPRWVNEGFATYLSSTKYLEAGQVELGGLQMGRLRTLVYDHPIEPSVLRTWRDDEQLSQRDLSGTTRPRGGGFYFYTTPSPPPFSNLERAGRRSR